MNVPSAIKIAAKWARVTPDRTTDYEEGVRNPQKDWATATANAETNYEQGVTKAISRKQFGKGVKRAGTPKQQGNSISKGIPRFGEGVRMAEDTMAAAMEGVVKTMQSVTLPPRYPKGDPRNYDRVKAIGDALNKVRIGG